MIDVSVARTNGEAALVSDDLNDLFKSIDSSEGLRLAATKRLCVGAMITVKITLALDTIWLRSESTHTAGTALPDKRFGLVVGRQVGGADRIVRIRTPTLMVAKVRTTEGR